MPIYRRDLPEFSSVSELRSLIVRPFENIKIQITHADNVSVTVAKVVDAISEQDAENKFSLIQVFHEYLSSELKISEQRSSTIDPIQIGSSYVEISVSVDSVISSLVVGSACEFRSSTEIGPNQIKALAGQVEIGSKSSETSIVLNAGKVFLEAELIEGSHFVDLKAGELEFSEGAQSDLAWRISTGLGQIKRKDSEEVLDNPYTGIIGNGSSRLTATVEVGDIRIG